MDFIDDSVHQKSEGEREKVAKQLLTISFPAADDRVQDKVPNAGEELPDRCGCDKRAYARDNKGN